MKTEVKTTQFFQQSLQRYEEALKALDPGGDSSSTVLSEYESAANTFAKAAFYWFGEHRCCERDHDFDGNCDIHPQIKGSFHNAGNERASYVGAPLMENMTAPQSDQPPPPAPGHLEHAAQLAGFTGEHGVRNWARSVLDAEAQRLIDGPPAIEKNHTPRDLGERLMRLRAFVAENLIRAALTDGFGADAAGKFAKEAIAAVEEGRKAPERSRIIAVSANGLPKTRG